MRPTDQKIENLINNLNDQTRPELDEKIIDDCFAELSTKKSSAPEKGPTIWSIIMHSKMTKPIAAAIIIIVALLSLTIFNKTVPQAYAIEQTLEALKHLETMHFFGRDWGNNEYEMWVKLNSKTGTPEYIYAHFFEKGIIDITRPDKSYQYNANGNRVLINSGKLYHVNTAPAKVFDQLLQLSHDDNGREQVNIYHEQDPETSKTFIVIDYENPKEARKIYIDPETKLPVRMIGLKNKHLGMIFKDIDFVEYNIELPEGIFEFQVTDDMKVLDMDNVMKQINDPQNGISGKGLTEQQAAELLVTDYWNALIAGDEETARKLSPAFPQILDISQITDLVEIGQLYIQNGCGIGKVVPCRLRYSDGSLKEVKLVIRFRNIKNQPSYSIAGSFGGPVTIEE